MLLKSSHLKFKSLGHRRNAGYPFTLALKFVKSLFVLLFIIFNQVGHVKADHDDGGGSILDKDMNLADQVQMDDRPKLSGVVLSGSCLHSESGDPDTVPYDKFTAIIPRVKLESHASPTKKEKITTTFVVTKKLELAEHGNEKDCFATGYLLPQSEFKLSRYQKGENVMINFYLFPKGIE